MSEKIDGLAKQALGGDEVAWNELFHLLTPRLWGLFRHLGSPPEHLEDLVQETWTRILKSRDKYDRERKFEPYIFTIASRLWIDHCRKTNPHPPDWSFPEDSPDDAPLPVDLMFAAERSEQLHHCVENLNAEDKRIIRQRFWENLTNRKIASALGVGESSIRSKAYRAICKLADCMQL